MMNTFPMRFSWTGPIRLCFVNRVRCSSARVPAPFVHICAWCMQGTTIFYQAHDKHVTVKVDTFAAGVMLAEICCKSLNVPGVAPLTTEYDYAMRERLLSDALERVRGAFPWVAALLQACTDKDMDRRCSAADALLILDGKPPRGSGELKHPTADTTEYTLWHAMSPLRCVCLSGVCV